MFKTTIKNIEFAFRPVRFTFDESLACLKKFKTFEDMLDHIVRSNNNVMCDVLDRRDVNFTYYGFDDRLSTDVYIVTTSRFLKENYLLAFGAPQAIGYFHLIYTKQTKFIGEG